MNGKKPEDYASIIDDACSQLRQIAREEDAPDLHFMANAVGEVFENWKSDRRWVGQLQDEVAKLHEERFALQAEIKRLKEQFENATQKAAYYDPRRYREVKG